MSFADGYGQTLLWLTREEDNSFPRWLIVVTTGKLILASGLAAFYDEYDLI